MNPGDTLDAERQQAPRLPLNEGRGVNPGDTIIRTALRACAAAAQRRPGREPRRHTPRARPGPRSRRTAQRRTPATLARCIASSRPPRVAQRRPGREPRRHGFPASTCRRRPRALNEGRGVNPGDTRRRWSRSPPHPAALNEGRGVNPGDTVESHVTPPSVERAQRRPGREPRRHSRATATSGAWMIAQRRPGREPRRHDSVPEAVFGQDRHRYAVVEARLPDLGHSDVPDDDLAQERLQHEAPPRPAGDSEDGLAPGPPAPRDVAPQRHRSVRRPRRGRRDLHRGQGQEHARVAAHPSAVECAGRSARLASSA